MAPRKPKTDPKTSVASDFAAEIDAEIDGALARGTVLTPEAAPGHTDLMVSPEEIERFTAENPPEVVEPITPPNTFDLRIGQYVRLRDKIKALDDAHKDMMKPYREALDGLNSLILDQLNKVGADSVRSTHGTAYRTQKKSASIQDADAFMRFVIGGEEWDLLDKRANVTACFDFADANKAPPPGVNLSSRFEVGVRRK